MSFTLGIKKARFVLCLERSQEFVEIIALHQAQEKSIAGKRIGATTVEITPRRRMDNIDEIIDLEKALERLTPRQRDVVLLWASGYTHKEIAKKYGLTRRRIGQICADAISLLGGLVT